MYLPNPLRSRALQHLRPLLKRRRRQRIQKFVALQLCGFVPALLHNPLLRHNSRLNLAFFPKTNRPRPLRRKARRQHNSDKTSRNQQAMHRSITINKQRTWFDHSTANIPATKGGNPLVNNHFHPPSAHHGTLLLAVHAHRTHLPPPSFVKGTSSDVP